MQPTAVRRDLSLSAMNLDLVRPMGNGQALSQAVKVHLKLCSSCVFVTVLDLNRDHISWCIRMYPPMATSTWLSHIYFGSISIIV